MACKLDFLWEPSMVPETLQRKLIAILSADVKGYSRLMGEDENGTVRTLAAYREVMADSIGKRRGRVVDSPGDNILAEFGSVVDAVRCAVEVQEELRARNAELPENRRMEFRMGINLGDVIVDGDRLYGDGVNIAARVEGLADGGGICISGTVYDQVENKLALQYEHLGEQAMKNIKKPVRVYRVRMWSDDSLPSAGGDLKLPDKPSIAVLPFVNISGDPEQEYFSDGITEDLITDLSKISGLFVIARHSVFTYKGKPVKVDQVGRDLGVKYVLHAGKPEEAIRLVKMAMRLNPHHHVWYFYVLGLSYILTERYREAFEILKRGLVRNPDFIGIHILMAGLYAQAGRMEEARVEVEEVLRISPDFSLEALKGMAPVKDQAALDRFVEALRKAGLS